MKTISQTYKDNIKELGKELTYEITYGNTTLGDEDILNANLHYDGGILQSVMKQLDLELYNDIPIGTEITYKFGVKIDLDNDTYEKINYGTFIVYSSEKQEDSGTYKIIAYDKMLYSMKDYENIGIEYPTTISDYIKALCSYLGLSFKNENEAFPNYDKVLENELYLDEDGNSLNFTFRDVLTELAQATASTICVENDTLELRYINDTGTQATSEGTSLNFTTQGTKIHNQIELTGQTTQSTTPTPTNPVPIETITGSNTIKVLGKNLFKTEVIENVSRSGLTFNSDGNTIKVNGVVNSTHYPSLTIFADGSYVTSDWWPTASTINTNKGFFTQSNLNYAISLINSGSATSTFRMITGKETSQDNDIVTINTTKTKTIATNSEKVNFISIGFSPSENYDLTINIQLERGSTITSYEPYKGNSYEINLGKNLFDYTTTAFSNTKVDITTENNTITMTTNEETNSGNLFFLTKIPDEYLENGVSYTISSENVSGVVQSLKLQLRNHDGTFVSGKSRADTIVYDSNYSLYVDGNIYSTNNSETIALGTTAIIKNVQVEKGTQPSSYSPYFTPIELCKIGNYEDRLFKTTGKNLLDLDLETIKSYNTTGTWNNNVYTHNGLTITINEDKTIKINGTTTAQETFFVKGGTIPFQTGTYYLSGAINGNNNLYDIRMFNYDGTSGVAQCFTGTKQINIINNSQSYNMAIVVRNGQTLNNVMFYPMLATINDTTYEPYSNNEWYLKKAIGKYNEWASVNARTAFTNTTRFQFKLTYPTTVEKRAYLLSNYFGNAINNDDTEHVFIGTGTSNVYDGLNVFISNSRATTNEEAINWLQTNGVAVYYVLATPTYTKIDNEELIGQLNAVQKLKLNIGTNNILQSNTSLPINLKLTYTNQLDTINEEYLKDINVNFGEMTPPINTITFKRSESDAISLSYPEDLADEEKNEIAISENQILNFDNRDEYLQDILDELYGLSYAINDFNSTGITFYELCDRYNVSITKTDDEGSVIETSVYPCLMLNDEINVNQGLEELVHTEMPEESVTDYNTTTATDRLQKRTDLIVNKQEGYIEAITGELGMVDGESQVINGIQSKQTDTESIINVITSKEIIDGEEVVTGVRTTKGFTFDKDGLKVQSSENTYRTKIDETGTFYYDGDAELGRTTNEGSAFKNMELYGEFRYGKDEYDETSLFVSMLFDDEGEECFGHFYAGREVE